MSRLIDADEAIPTLEGLTEQVQTEGATLVKALIFAALKFRSVIPTVDAVPVKHRRWELVDEAEPRRYGCSECSCLSWYGTYKYCPNCGARMDGETDEHG